MTVDGALPGPGYTGLLSWFLAIVALIPLTLWLLRRSRLGASLSSGPVKVISQTPIGPGQRLLVIEVRHGAQPQTLLLGVTAQQINLVAELHPAPGTVVQETA